MTDVWLWLSCLQQNLKECSRHTFTCTRYRLVLLSQVLLNWFMICNAQSTEITVGWNTMHKTTGQSDSLFMTCVTLCWRRVGNKMKWNEPQVSLTHCSQRVTSCWKRVGNKMKVEWSTSQSDSLFTTCVTVYWKRVGNKMKWDEPQVSLTHCSQHMSLHIGGVRKNEVEWTTSKSDSLFTTCVTTYWKSWEKMKLNESQISVTHCSWHVSLYIGRELWIKWSGMNP